MSPPRIFKQSGWEFSARRNVEPNYQQSLEEKGFDQIEDISDFAFCITHLDSGIQFRFQGYDALCKWHQEKFNSPHGFDFPTYASPLRPADGYDSAYTGRILLDEKRGEEPRDIHLQWMDIDWETLHQQIVWMKENDLVSGEKCHGHFPLRYCEGLSKRFTGRTSKEKKIPVKGRKSRKGLPEAILNFMVPLYVDAEFSVHGRSSCDLCLVVTNCGWFASLQQSFFNIHGARRLREMTMHCNFEENTIYREIIERQSKDFMNRLHSACKDIGRSQSPEVDDEMLLHFHEAKRLVIPGAYMEGPSSCTVLDRRSTSLFAVDERESNETFAGAFSVSDDKVESLFANCGKEIKSIEETQRFSIEIIPLFRHPEFYERKGFRREPRKAYQYRHSKDDDDCVKISSV